jgi:hypothetical protein
MISKRISFIGICTVALAVPRVSTARPEASDVWQIELGASISAIPDSFSEFACGTDGGPPAQPLGSFVDFGQCSPEPSGWHEVYFRYDDELEYWAKAKNIPLLVAQAGTKVYDLPVIMSVLIDDSRIVRGLRLVSDPRDTSVGRAEARLLQPFLKSRFDGIGGNHWICTDKPLADGETPVGGEALKRDCTMEAESVSYDVSVRYFRRPGQRQIDHTGHFTEGEFTSMVRFEMHQL